MSSVIKKCPKDGIVYDASFTGNCASCFGPLKFFCKTHNEWLAVANCPKCDGTRTAVTPAAARVPSTGPSIVGMLAVLAICIGVFVMCGLFLYRAFIAPPKPVSSPAGRPVAPTPAKPATVPTPIPATPPTRQSTVVSISLGQLLADPDPHLGQAVKLSGTIQFRDTGRETFDLRDGDHIVTVQYAGMPGASKTTVAGTSTGRPLSVTGVWRRDEADNSYYVVAGSVELP
jgi:hypothetical protein